MPRASSPEKYPTQFHAMLDKVLADGELFIPHEHPTSFRGYLQSFLFAVEKAPNHPKGEAVKNLMVRKVDGGVIVCDRDRSPAAMAVAAALGESGASASAAENSFLNDLIKVKA